MNPHSKHPASFAAILKTVWRNRGLIVQMTQREVIGRYRGSAMGLAWSFFNPVLMLVVYTFFFSVVFKARWGTLDDNKGAFAVVLFVGLILHSLLAECINRAPTLILANVNYVKKVIFPLEILPIVALGSALFHSAISLLVLLIAEVILLHALPWTALLFPLILAPLLIGAMGFAWFLSAFGVYVRDIAQITGILTSVLMFLSPVFYPVSNLPPQYQTWIRLNPLTFIIEEGRNTLIFGKQPDWTSWLVCMAGSILVCWFGFWWFQRARRGFADVL
ncbi:MULTISPECIES: ABC transporter permease [unclassified Caballeronia]|uniref:ABC transporter permease n=1 Tax=unclassified Caballeronia TaxID=2646786 RepID=UPI002866B704|nr:MULTISPECIES: ABC transporter permease [unclassified Caballeronia]MDR5814325.1 ABC transporter permease [Caballeronia sp. LZ033]MDR5820802.1 ABC transporter permease [Caballeronia sp. LZ043]MDR5878903.1 ABC transporter permease [Caballeronia sp. LZ032]